MYYVYVLELAKPSKMNGGQYGGEKYYVGITQNLLDKLERHKRGRGAAVTTRCGVKSLQAVYTVGSERQAKRLERILSYRCHRRIPFDKPCWGH